MSTGSPGDEADVVVLGAGIAGSCVAHFARRAGLTALLFDAALPDAGSPAALAVVREAWAKTPDDKAATHFALAHFGGLGALTSLPAAIIPRNGPHSLQYDWAVIDPARALLPHTRATATDLHFQRRVVTLGGFYRAHARLAVVVCCGIHNRDLGGPEAAVTYGATALLPHAGPPAVRVHRLRPYHNLIDAALDGQRRIGSSTSRDPAAAIPALRADLERIGLDPDRDEDDAGLCYATGARAHAASRGHYATHIDGTHFLGGFGKLGYALAPAAAYRLIERIKEGR